MVFSTNVFLFLFLPVLLGLHALCPWRMRNSLLLAASLLFYAWGGPAFLPVMLASVASNYFFGLWVARWRGGPRAAWPLAAAVVFNLGYLAWFKYAAFAIESLAWLVAPLGLSLPDAPHIELPVGISFFTFQAMSYVIDVYRGEAAVERRPANVALYVALFPQLIAGPIVRYRDIAAQLAARRVFSLEGFAAGVQRFVIGLAKKILLANSAGLVADAVFDIPAAQLTGAVAWLGLAAYTLQIYFDFSGYSDMAIGLGKLFGFEFLENFNYPYAARSVTDFWRRWHISLSTWFRDYLYIPLGGNRGGSVRTCRNLVLVFLLCGLWHGASWTFVVWGLFHGAFLVLERAGLARLLGRAAAPVGHAYTLVAVMAGWVFFRADGLAHAAGFFQALCGLSPATGWEHPLAGFVDAGVVVTLAAGALAALPWLPLCGRWLAALRRRFEQPSLAGRTLESLLQGARLSAVALLLAASAAAMAASTYNPFIYFQF